MQHSFLDRYSDRDSIVHRLDPRTKFVATLVLILAVALTPPDMWLSYAVYAGLLAVCLVASRVPPRYVLRRSLVIVPFVALIAVFVPFFHDGQIAGSYSLGGWQLSVTYDGLQVLRNILVRAWLSITALVLLAATTRMSELLHAMEMLHLPRVLVMILSFMYRYIFVLVDEVMRLKMARTSRNFGSGGTRLWRVRVVGSMIGTLFIRSYERAERVYAAMVSRGFDGGTRSLRRLRLGKADFAAAALCAGSIAVAMMAVVL